MTTDHLFSKPRFLRVVLFFILLSALLPACRETSGEQAIAPPPPLVKTLVLTPDDTATSRVYSGEVHSRFETPLAFRVPGKIIRRVVDQGDRVKSKDLIMQVDPTDIRQAVAAASAQKTAAESRFTLARDQLKRFKALYKKDMMSKAELDRYQDLHDSAKALLSQARAQYTQALNQESYCDLTTDSPGIILAVRAEEGQVVAAGQPVVILAREEEKEVEIDLPENQVKALGEGHLFKATFWALPGVSVKGHVRTLSPVADPVTRTYKARIALENPPDTVKLGMTASVSSLEQRGSRHLFIPLSAVYQTGETPMVWVVNNDGTVHLEKIDVGEFAPGNRIEVLKGIEPGTRIVVAGVHKLAQGEQVRVQEDEP